MVGIHFFMSLSARLASLVTCSARRVCVIESCHVFGSKWNGFCINSAWNDPDWSLSTLQPIHVDVLSTHMNSRLSVFIPLSNKCNEQNSKDPLKSKNNVLVLYLEPMTNQKWLSQFSFLVTCHCTLQMLLTSQGSWSAKATQKECSCGKTSNSIVSEAHFCVCLASIEHKMIHSNNGMSLQQMPISS